LQGKSHESTILPSRYAHIPIQSLERNQQGKEKQSKDHALAGALLHHEATTPLIFAVQHIQIGNIFILWDGYIFVEIQEVQTDVLPTINANKKSNDTPRHYTSLDNKAIILFSTLFAKYCTKVEIKQGRRESHHPADHFIKACVRKRKRRRHPQSAVAR
jgi:hypothetical protein